MRPNHTTNDIPYGYCHCGCGQLTTIPTKTNRKNGRIKGQPMRFIHNHSQRVNNSNFRPLPERFWKKVAQRGPDDCWEWQGAIDKHGYGQIKMRNHKHVRAHRVSYEIAYGTIADGLGVLHKCDNPPCVNPAHLFLGTTADNVADKIAKGRQLRGEQIPWAILTAADVIEIRRLHESGVTQRAIALQFGTSYKNVHNIIRHNSWKHLP